MPAQTYGPNTSQVIGYLRVVEDVTTAQVVIAGRAGRGTLSPQWPEFERDDPFSPWDRCLVATLEDVQRVLSRTPPFKAWAAEREANPFRNPFLAPEFRALGVLQDTALAIAVGRGHKRKKYDRIVAPALGAGLVVPDWESLKQFGPEWDYHR